MANNENNPLPSPDAPRQDEPRHSSAGATAGETVDHTSTLRREISAHRSAVAARRARAFIDCPDRVLGLPVRPLTVATWTMLHATGSRFLLGGTPMEGDVRNYLWFHSRLFPLALLLPAPCSLLLKWLALLPFTAVIRLHPTSVNHYCAVIARATDDIHGILAEAFAEAPAPGNRDGTAPAGCLEAQLLHLFVSEYGWTPSQVRALPLARLLQLARQFSDPGDDPSEQAIKWAHLSRRNDALRQERELKAGRFADVSPRMAGENVGQTPGGQQAETVPA